MGTRRARHNGKGQRKEAVTNTVDEQIQRGGEMNGKSMSKK